MNDQQITNNVLQLADTIKNINQKRFNVKNFLSDSIVKINHDISLIDDGKFDSSALQSIKIEGDSSLVYNQESLSVLKGGLEEMKVKVEEFCSKQLETIDSLEKDLQDKFPAFFETAKIMVETFGI